MLTTVELPYRQSDFGTVADFAAPFLDGTQTGTAEVGDGNLNRVFRVSAKRHSVIVKRALPYLKAAGESWPLTRHRARTE